MNDSSLNAKAWFGLAAVTLMTVYAMKKDPELLRRRMSGGPAAENKARRVVARPGLSRRDRRRTGRVVFYVAFLAFRENSFAAATIQIADDQNVVSTGIYGRIRHPMYAGGLALFGGTARARFVLGITRVPFRAGGYHGNKIPTSFFRSCSSGMIVRSSGATGSSVATDILMRSWRLMGVLRIEATSS